jgi:hypothetical protein
MKPVTKPKDPRERDKDRGGEREGKPSTLKSIQANKTAALLNQMTALNMSKPTNVEAQRVLTIIEAAIEKVMIAAYLDGEFMGNFSDSSKSKGTEEFLTMVTEKTGKMLIKLGDFENKLRPHLLQSESQEKVNEIDKNEQGGIDFPELMNQTRTIVRNLVRGLQNNPSDLDAIRSKKKHIWEEYEAFLDGLKSIRVIMLKKLSTSAEEENAHIKQIQELKVKIKDHEANKNTRELELQNIKKERSKYTSEKNEELNKLKADIQEVKNKKKQRKDDADKQSKVIIDASIKAFTEKDVKAKEKLKLLKEALAELIKKNKAEEEQLKKKKQQGEAQLKEVIESYDLTMDKKTLEKKDLEKELEKIREELANIKVNLSMAEHEKKKEQDIIEKIQKKKDVLETDDQRINQIILSIQNAWKNFKAKSGGKKKKKKKKKK